MNRKVVVFSRFLPPEGGGAELATKIIVEKILAGKNDGEVVVVTGTTNPHLDVRNIGIRVVPLLKRSKPFNWLFTLRPPRWLYRLLSEASLIYIASNTLLPLAIIAKKVNPTARIVLHLHDHQVLTYTSAYCPPFRPGVGADFLFELRETGSWLKALGVASLSTLNIISSISLEYADLVICVSRLQCEVIRRHTGISPRKSIVVYNPIPRVPHVVKNLGEQVTLIYPGGGSFVKGFYTLLEALPRVVRYVDIVVIATKPLPRRAEKLLYMISKATSGKVRIIGKLPYQEYLSLHQRAWGLLHPSRCIDPLPYSVVEAILTNTTPIISWNVGLTDVLEKTRLREFIVKPGDSDDLAEKVEHFSSTSRYVVEAEVSKARNILISRIKESEELLRDILKTTM